MSAEGFTKERAEVIRRAEAFSYSDRARIIVACDNFRNTYDLHHQSCWLAGYDSRDAELASLKAEMETARNALSETELQLDGVRADLAAVEMQLSETSKRRDEYAEKYAAVCERLEAAEAQVEELKCQIEGFEELMAKNAAHDELRQQPAAETAGEGVAAKLRDKIPGGFYLEHPSDTAGGRE